MRLPSSKSHFRNLTAYCILALFAAGLGSAVPVHHESETEHETESGHEYGRGHEARQISNLKRAAPALAAAPAAMNNISANDLSILNFALTLEHMESAFYTGGLSQYTPSDFASAGLPAYAYGRFQEIAEHEGAHVQLLHQVLGTAGAGEVAEMCSYSFPYTDPLSFAAMSMVFEGVGASAYLGASSLLTEPYLMTIAGAMMTTEARQATWVASLNNATNPWSTSFETPLTASQAASLASAFITSCPPTNPPLTAQPFPPLNITTPNPQPGEQVTLVYDTTPSSIGIGGATGMGSIGGNGSTPGGDGEQYLVLLSGLNAYFTPIINASTTSVSPQTAPNLYFSAPQQITSGSAVIPPGLQGTVYALVSSSNSTVADAYTVAGMAIMQFGFGAGVNNTGDVPVVIGGGMGAGSMSMSYSESYSESYTESYTESSTYSSTYPSSAAAPMPMSMMSMSASSSLPFVVSTLSVSSPAQATEIITCN